MYKSIITYKWGRGRRIRNTHYSRTRIGALLKAWTELLFKNKEFYEINTVKAE